MRDSAAREGLRSFKSFVAFQPADCEQSIVERFEKHAAQHANNSAVRLQERDVGYAELNADANRAARVLLKNLNVRTDRDRSPPEARPIALLLHQGYDSIVWTLAALKAGFCYAPLDQRLPQPVLRAIVDHLAPGALIAAPAYLDSARSLGTDGCPPISADVDRQQYSDANLDVSVTPDSPAYVFFTSGSTGSPKGVVDCQRNVLHNVLRYTNTLKFAPDDVLSLVQNPSFSGTVSTLFGALLNGAAIAPFDLQSDGLVALSPWLKHARVTVFHGVPSIFRQLADPAEQFPDIRLVRLEGDRASAFDLEHFRKNFSDRCTLVNGLGATECGLVRQFFFDKQTRLDGDEALPIGYPVPDVTARVVDEHGDSLPPGSDGEIVVESAFLAREYWRDAKLTVEKFINLKNDQRRYRTGDLGRMREDGCLVHLGRIDHRVRIAGEFVDTAAIEQRLLSVKGVKQCVLHDFEDRVGERRLCAYVVADPGITVTDLHQALAPHANHSALPSAFVFLDVLPLTNDLKIDYQRLPRPTRQRPPLANKYVAPQSRFERNMARIWSEVLEIDDIGVTDSFFELGGTSLHATRIVSRLAVNHLSRIQISTLFSRPTIRALQDFIASQD